MLKIKGKKKSNGEDVSADKKGMKCPACKKKGMLRAICVITVEAPIAKGGGIKLAGIPVTHKTAKEAWDKQEKTIVCRNTKCATKFVYEDGLQRVQDE